MAKIVSGHYKYTYKGFDFFIIKVEEINSHTKNKWFWKCGKEGGDDWLNTKKDAIEAAKDCIDNNFYK